MTNSNSHSNVALKDFFLELQGHNQRKAKGNDMVISIKFPTLKKEKVESNCV
jgi:hypothetical protein